MIPDGFQYNLHGSKSDARSSAYVMHTLEFTSFESTSNIDCCQINACIRQFLYFDSLSVVSDSLIDNVQCLSMLAIEITGFCMLKGNQLVKEDA